MMDSRCILVGAGAFGRELINWARDAELKDSFPPLAGFIDDTHNGLKNPDYNLQSLGSIQDYQPKNNDIFLMGVSDPQGKESVVNILKGKGAKFITLIHPTAIVAKTARLGEGTILCPLSMVSADATVGNFVTINSYSGVGHDVHIGDYTTMSGHVDLTGRVKCGRSVFLGTGAKVIPDVSIGDSAIIGAGTLIVRSVKAGVTMYAMPSQKLQMK
jgi:sugar O-acyltransferase (sialic acid O-acetyltransferase NeuD family)